MHLLSIFSMALFLAALAAKKEEASCSKALRISCGMIFERPLRSDRVIATQIMSGECNSNTSYEWRGSSTAVVSGPLITAFVSGREIPSLWLKKCAQPKKCKSSNTLLTEWKITALFFYEMRAHNVLLKLRPHRLFLKNLIVGRVHIYLYFRGQITIRWRYQRGFFNKHSLKTLSKNKFSKKAYWDRSSK